MRIRQYYSHFGGIYKFLVHISYMGKIVERRDHKMLYSIEKNETESIRITNYIFLLWKILHYYLIYVIYDWLLLRWICLDYYYLLSYIL